MKSAREEDVKLVLLRTDESEEDAEMALPRATESEWVEQARAGNREAFGELVRKHRAAALGVANRMVRDVHMAEDVVQDALIRAFIHLGTLMDAGKFAPWLHRIVRNQALLKLRRGGPYAKEQPFSGITAGGGSPQGPTNRRVASDAGGEMDWTDIDCILFRLQSAASEESRSLIDPSDCLVRSEMLSGLRDLLHVLSKRERRIFEAHFFDQLSPAEIAKLLGTTSASVYNSLSRARVKVRQERTRVTLSLYVKRRAEQGLPRRKVLTPPL
ncbi:sigma-70 family RNA polymerase sigma factor [Paenibacillus filicis]|uniref:RNA polymerase sigma factor n=1 Tax=Paenibacillus filicis TaxID=669464 RepID=A0ABU9DHT1_9BACL